jgi:GGDEF domain-containing protein
MTAAPRERRRTESAAVHSLDQRTLAEFRRAVVEALKSSGSGRPNVLAHLDVARATDIHDVYGREGTQALEALLHAMLYNQLGPNSPVLCGSACAITILLCDTLPRDAIAVGRRLRGAIDRGTFRWHGHPFRLGASLGMVELEAEPSRAEVWLDRAREACDAARDLGGSGIQLVSAEKDAWGEIEREREWHKHIAEVI